MRKPLLSLFLFFIFISTTSAQKRFITVAEESFTVNSQTALNGKSYNIVEVTLPKKAVGIIYRITSGSIGTLKETKPLLLQLKDYSPDDFTINNSLGRMTIKSDNPRPINMYIMDHAAEAAKFQSGQPFSPCKKFENRSEICFFSDECIITDKLYFGFINPDVATGADVQFELIAVVDDSAVVAAKNYPFVITNTTNSSVQIQWSKDGNVHSTPMAIPGSTVITQKFPDNTMYVTVRTSLFKFKKYQVISDFKYEIFWNPTFQGWDLSRKG